MKYLIMLIVTALIGCKSKTELPQQPLTLHSVEVNFVGDMSWNGAIISIEYAELICTDTSCYFGEWKPWNNNKLHAGKWFFRALKNEQVIGQTGPLEVPKHRKFIIRAFPQSKNHLIKSRRTSESAC